MTTYLVLGGTGKTGRRLATRLAEAGHSVRSAARTPGPPAPGVEPVGFDWADEATHDAALAGVEGVWVIPPALSTSHAPQVGGFAARAAAAGVRRLVLLSARGVDAGGPNPLIDAEHALAASAGPAQWSVVRPSWFAQNFTESFFAPGIADGVVVAPTGDGAEPFIDADDIAAVAAALLTTDGHGGRAYDLSGPQALTFAEVAEVLTGVLGRPVRHVDLPVQEWAQGAVAGGIPADYAELLGHLFTVIRDGHDAYVSDGVQQVLGRPASSFADWAVREAASLRS